MKTDSNLVHFSKRSVAEKKGSVESFKFEMIYRFFKKKWRDL